MAYIVDTTTGNLGNYKSGGTIDYNTANKQAQARAKAKAAAAATGTTTTGGGVVENPEPEVYEGNDYSAGFDYASLLAAQLAAQRAAAQEAYNRNMDRIASTYNSASGNLKSNYDSTVSRLNAARDKSMGEVNSDAEDSLRQAYINNMLSKKNLNQRLSAMGYNGGATESTMASLSNNYGNSRTDINNTLNDNIADLNATYGDNLASALQSYNSAMSNLDLQRMQLENAAESQLASTQASSLSGIGSLLSMDQSYLNSLASALSAQNNYTYTGTQATNDYNPASVTQAASASSDSSNYAKYLAQSQLDAANGSNLSTIKANLFEQVRNGNLGIDSLYQILNQLGTA